MTTNRRLPAQDRPAQDFCNTYEGFGFRGLGFRGLRVRGLAMMVHDIEWLCNTLPVCLE